MSSKRVAFTVSTGEPDEIDLELASIGADPSAAQRIAAAPHLRAAAAEIQMYRSRHEARAIPLDLRARRGLQGGLGWSLAAAAAALLVIGTAVFANRAQPTDGVRSMGGLPIDVAVRPADGSAWFPDSGVAAGDAVYLRMRAPRDGVVEVVTVEADGDVSVLEPGEVVQAGDLWTLGGAARLDGQPDPEWLVVTLRPAGLDAAEIEREARSLLPDPARSAGPTRYVFEVTRRR